MNQKPQDKPKLTYWHVWTDDDGISHQTCCKLTNFARESIGGDATLHSTLSNVATRSQQNQ